MYLNIKAYQFLKFFTILGKVFIEPDRIQGENYKCFFGFSFGKIQIWILMLHKKLRHFKNLKDSERELIDQLLYSR